MHRRKGLALLVVLALMLGWFAAAPPARAQQRVVTLVGDLQSELGCSADWQPVCTGTDLVQHGNGYSRAFTVPAGEWQLKVVINHSWNESYGAQGGSANIPLALTKPARLLFGYDDATHLVTIKPLDLPGSTTAADRKLAVGSLREALTRERFYFLMADRFANGNKSNDTGGLVGGPLKTGFDPTDSGFYHGGDLKGVAAKLDYIKGLGTTAIWLTPSFKNNPVQGSGNDVSAGYHGYWITDFTQIDPHLGSNADMKALIAKAHAKGMKVFFDIITNHTADIIDYADPTAGGTTPYTYINKETAPYRTAGGQDFDDRDYVNKQFPALDPATSFPYTPTFRTEADKTVKVPAWLNDPTLYHNRGNSTFAGESSTYGDFVGLDDLFTENPTVVEGMEKVYQTWADFGIDGFRIDTVKHVNTEFWQQFIPSVLNHAKAKNDDFFMFGEVYDSSPTYTSQYTTTGRLQATLDFGFQNAALGFAQGKATTGLRDLYAGDDWYTDADSNAYQLPTFTGNHDMGRMSYLLRSSGVSAGDTLTRLKLANALMYLTRGQPVVYYGDEQGFAGSGGDKASRQDMFATKVPAYAKEEVIGGPSGSRDRYNTSAPLYRQVAQLAKLRARHPALADGAQVHRYASNEAGIFAVSRIDKASRREYLVVTNNATEPASATFASYSPNTRFDALLGAGGDVRADRAGRVTVRVPALGVRVFRATKPMPGSSAAPVIVPLTPKAGGTVGGRAELSVALADTSQFAEVSFYYRPAGTTDWKLIGTDDNPRYRVYQDVTGLPKGSLLEYRIVAKDLSGRYSATSSWAFVGDPVGSSGPGTISYDPPEKQPGSVSVPGSFNASLGCAADWLPDCDKAKLALDAEDQIWKASFNLPAGDYDYKAALNGGWDENYGAGGARNGSNINVKPTGGTVGFYYDHATHWVTSSAQGPILTAPGSFQSELGCTSDWKPDCMRPWLQDLDGDGTYTWASVKIPQGSYEFKIAHGLTTDETYPADNVPLTVPSDGMRVTITYVLATHQVSVSVAQPSATPDLSVARAVLVGDGLIAYPAHAVPAGASPSGFTWRLHASAKGGLAIDADAVVGGQVYTLTRVSRGLLVSFRRAHPELANAIVLRVEPAAAIRMKRLLAGQVAVAMYDDQGRLVDATGLKRA